MQDMQKRKTNGQPDLDIDYNVAQHAEILLGIHSFL